MRIIQRPRIENKRATELNNWTLLQDKEKKELSTLYNIAMRKLRKASKLTR